MVKPRKTITVTLTRPIPPTVEAALDALKETFPAAFHQPAVPLPEGILQQAHEALADQHSKKAVRRALALWCSRTDYLRAVVADDAHRVNLDGSDGGPVPDEQRESALRRLEAKGAPVQPPQPRPPSPAARSTPRSPTTEGPVVIKKKVQIRHKTRLSPATGEQGQRPTLSLRKRPSDKK